MTRSIRLLRGLRELVPAYDGFILDLWGVIHDGVTPYPGAVDCLTRLKAAGKKFVMLSNAPRRAAAISAAMVEMGIPPELAGPVMSSGEATWRQLARRDDPWYAALGTRCLHIGPPRDTGLFDGLDLVLVSAVEDAEFIVNTGPWIDGETVADYEDRLARAAARGLAMICANPDIEVIRGGQRLICAGALAERYRTLGGELRYNGKPDPAIYRDCFEVLGGARRGRLLAIGDSLRTDIAGAAAAGIDAVLVTGGIHADELAIAPGRKLDAARLETVCRRAGHMPIGAVAGLSW